VAANPSARSNKRSATLTHGAARKALLRHVDRRRIASRRSGDACNRSPASHLQARNPFKPGLLERILVAVGVRPGLARFTATTPSLRLGWLLANTLVLLLVAWPLALKPAAAWPSAVLLAAPLVAAAAVAFAYGPAVDPAYEAVAATPLSPVRALLVRLAAVLVAYTALAGAVDLALGGRGPSAGWLLPMTAAALLAVLVASRWTPGVGAAAGMGAWLLVLATWKASQQPVTWLTGPTAQAAYATVAVALLVLLVRRMAREGWTLPDQAEPA
jgi:hypothetical protein